MHRVCKTDPKVKSEGESSEDNGYAYNGMQQEDEVEEGSSKQVDEKDKKKKGKKGGKTTKKPKPEVIEEDDEEEYEVEAVLASRYMRGKRQFKVRWLNYGPEEDSWVGVADLHCPDLIQEFLDSEGADDAGESSAASTSKKSPGRKRKAADTKNEVDRVLEVKFKKNGKREFLIHWKGFSSNEDTWEPEEHLNCTELINKLMKQVDKNKELTERELRVQPKQTDHLKLKNPQTRTSPRQPKGGRPNYREYLN